MTRNPKSIGDLMDCDQLRVNHSFKQWKRKTPSAVIAAMLTIAEQLVRLQNSHHPFVPDPEDDEDEW